MTYLHTSGNSNLKNMAAPRPLQQLHDVQTVSGKGRGLIALVDIEPGEQIICEAPMFRFREIWPARDATAAQRAASHAQLSHEIESKVSGLSSQKQQFFLTLHNNQGSIARCSEGAGKLFGITRTNVLPSGSFAGHPHGGVLPNISMTNHDCLPNASYNWNASLQCGTLHATRSIAAGEEITKDYCKGLPSAARTVRLQPRENLGFRCTCRLCSSEPDHIAESDLRREETMLIQRRLKDSQSNKRHPDEELDDCRKMLELLIVEYSGTYHEEMAWTYERAFIIAAFHGDHERASIFAERAYLSSVVCQGSDSQMSRRLWSFMKDPRRYPRYGTEDSWGISSSLYFGIPRGLNPLISEAWLWKMGLRHDTRALTRADVGHI